VLARAERGVPEAARATERLLAELGDALARAEAERGAVAEAQAELSARLAAAAERERAATAAQREREQRRLADLGALEAQARVLLREVRREAEKAAAERDTAALRSLGERVRGLEQAGDAWRETARAADGAAPAEVAAGMELRHAGLDVVGRVVEGPDGDGNVVLARGAWRITCKVADLRPVAGGTEAGAPPRRGPAVGARPEPAAGSEVDVRGLAADEALSELDRALDRAVLAGLAELRVIHGVGRGVLREAVVRHLAAHPQVAGQRMGGLGEGGRGVTVAQLA
jgi:DNA mismatch repair protein MutS2